MLRKMLIPETNFLAAAGGAHLYLSSHWTVGLVAFEEQGRV